MIRFGFHQIFVVVLGLGFFSCAADRYISAPVAIDRDALTDDMSGIGFSIKHVEFVPLETRNECILGQITKTVNHGGDYYILSGGAIYRFGADGHFAGNIGRKGQGPGEYNLVNTFFFEGDSLYAIDGNTERMLVYDREGRYARSVIVPSELKMAQDIIPVDHNKAIVSNSVNFLTDALYSLWSPYNPDSLTALSISEFTFQGSMVFSNHPMARYGSQVFCLRPYNSVLDVWTVDTDSVVGMITVEGLGKAPKPQSRNYMEAYMSVLSGAYSAILNIFCNEKFIFFDIPSGSIVWNIEKNAGARLPAGVKMTQPEFPLMLSKMQYVTPDECVAIRPASELLQWIEANPGNPILDALDEESNPVIVRYILN